MSTQYMVLKMVGKGLKGVLNMVPMMGAVSQPIAEGAVERMTKEDPDGVFLLQEVGAA
jgi:hypothetical protein